MLLHKHDIIKFALFSLSLIVSGNYIMENGKNSMTILENCDRRSENEKRDIMFSKYEQLIIINTVRTQLLHPRFFCKMEFPIIAINFFVYNYKIS